MKKIYIIIEVIKPADTSNYTDMLISMMESGEFNIKGLYDNIEEAQLNLVELQIINTRQQLGLHHDILTRYADQKPFYRNAISSPNLDLVTSEWIRQRRKAKGLTLEELGKLTGTTKNQVSAWESDSDHSRTPRGPAKAALWYALHEQA